MTVLILIIPLLVLGFISYNKSKTSLDDLGAINLANSAEMTIQMIDLLNEEVKKGTLTLDEAQEKVKIAILGENGYLFIVDENGQMAAHPYI